MRNPELSLMGFLAKWVVAHSFKKLVVVGNSTHPFLVLAVNLHSSLFSGMLARGSGEVELSSTGK